MSIEPAPASSDGTRVLLVPSGIGRAHVARLLLVARELRARGAEAAFAARPGEELLAQEEFDVFPTSDVDVTDYAENVYALYTPELVRRMVEEELAASERFRPDVVVGDLRMTAAISARIAGVPYVSVVSASMTKAFDPVDLMLPEERGRARHFAASVAGRGIQAVQKRSLAAPFRKVAKERGVRGLDELYDFLDGDLTLVTDIPEFVPLEDLPDNCRYVGPLVWEPPGDGLPESVTDVPAGRALVYATTGNTGHPRLVELVLEGFADEPHSQVVVTTGAYVDPEPYREVAKNVHVERFLPGAAVLDHAAVVVHAGGHGTTYQALAKGVPAVVLPFNNEQRINAWLVKRRGVGMAVEPEETDGLSVRVAAAKVVQDPDVRASLWRFQELLRTVDAPRRAADEILELAGGGG